RHAEDVDAPRRKRAAARGQAVAALEPLAVHVHLVGPVRVRDLDPEVAPRERRRDVEPAAIPAEAVAADALEAPDAGDLQRAPRRVVEPRVGPARVVALGEPPAPLERHG